MRSTQQHNPMVDLFHYQLEASMHLAEVVFSGTEKIDRAMLDVSHQAVDGQLALARAVTDFRDPVRREALQASLASRPEKAMQCHQQIMSVMLEIQSAFGQSLRRYLERCSQNAAQQTGELMHSAESAGGSGHGPGTPANLANPFTGMLAVWEEAFREAGKLASQNVLVAGGRLESGAVAVDDLASQGEAILVPNGRHRQASGRAKQHSGTRRKG
ncbi:MAG: phasin family protein [Oxalobacteraceae bacterium]